jgi:hypothetical protein
LTLQPSFLLFRPVAVRSAQYGALILTTLYLPVWTDVIRIFGCDLSFVGPLEQCGEKRHKSREFSSAAVLPRVTCASASSAFLPPCAQPYPLSHVLAVQAMAGIILFIYLVSKRR